MKTEIEISAHILKAVLTHAAKDDIRFYMNGIHFRDHNGVLVIEATDGHRAIKVTLNKIKVTEPLDAVISRDDIKMMLNWKEKILRLVFSDTTVAEPDIEVTFNLINPWSVNIDAVLPDKKPDAKYLQGSYNLEHLVDQRNASNLIFGVGKTFQFPTIVQFSDIPNEHNLSSPCFHDKTSGDIRVEGVISGLRFQGCMF